MEWIFIVLIIGLIVWRSMPAKGVGSVTTEELKGMLNNKTKQFIDVRTPAEFKGRHLKEFDNIPLNNLKAQASRLDQSKETIVIFRSGMRSTQATKVLNKLGFTNVSNVTGGMSAWRG